MTAPLCRLLPFSTAEGAWNMAADETLLEAAAAGIASLRFYAWSQPTLSLGYFQSSAVCRAYPRLGELAWVRRASGGAALVHHHEITYALALPSGLPWQKRGESWPKTMHAILRDALVAFGVSASLCNPADAEKRDDVLCFHHLTPCDVHIDKAKIAGSAQRKQRGTLLQHGGLLLAASPFTPALPGIRELVGVILDPSSLCAAIQEQFARSSGWQLVPADWSASDRSRTDELAQNKYAQATWNEKR
jgi:lipoate-protein ligase A